MKQLKVSTLDILHALADVHSDRAAGVYRLEHAREGDLALDEVLDFREVVCLELARDGHSMVLEDHVHVVLVAVCVNLFDVVSIPEVHFVADFLVEDHAALTANHYLVDLEAKFCNLSLKGGDLAVLHIYDVVTLCRFLVEGLHAVDSDHDFVLFLSHLLDK